MKQNSNKSLVGTITNNLTIVAYITKKINGYNRQYFEFVCFCGTKFEARCERLQQTTSCGCITGNLISQKNTLANNIASQRLIHRVYQTNATRRGLSFDLSFDEFIALSKQNCYYCDTPPKEMTFSPGKNRRSKSIVCNGVDRQNNSLGYTIENCVACCTICNTAKSNLKLEEFLAWIKRITDYTLTKEKHGDEKIST